MQVGQLVTPQDPRHRPGRDPELGPEPVLAPAFPDPCRHDPYFGLDTGASGAVVWPGGSVDQAGLTCGLPAVDPAVRALTRHPLRLRRVRHRPALLDHTLHQQPPAEHRQMSPTLGHGRTSFRMWTFASHTPMGVLPFVNQYLSPTSRPSTPRSCPTAVFSEGQLALLSYRVNAAPAPIFRAASTKPVTTCIIVVAGSD